MNLSPDIVRRLLSGEHFNADERQQLGIASSTVLKYDDLVCFLADILEQIGRFPECRVKNDSGFVQEGISIEKSSQNLFLCICQRASPIDPSVLAERCEKHFSTAEDAADFYLTWELNLPGRLDGIEVR